MSCVLFFSFSSLLHIRGCFTLGQSSPGERERLRARLQLASQETGVTILQTPDTRPFQSPGPRKSAATTREGSPHGAGERTSLRGSGTAGLPTPRGAGRGGSPQPSDSNLASARTAELGRRRRPRPPARPPAERRPDFPPSSGRRPARRGSESRHRRPGRRRVRWGRGRATSARRVGRTKRRRRELFSVSAPRSLRRLLTEAGSVALERVGARQRPRPRPGAGAQRGFTDLARSRPPAARAPLPPALPPRPVSRPEGGGPGRAGGGARPARGLPGAVVPRCAPWRVWLPRGGRDGGGRHEALSPCEVPRGTASAEQRAVRVSSDALDSNPHFAIR